MGHRNNLQKHLEVVREIISKTERSIIHTAIIPDKETLQLLQGEIETAVNELINAEDEIGNIINSDEDYEKL